MKIFLQLKHWQIFFLTWGIPIVIDIYAFTDPGLLIRLFPIMLAIFSITYFGWIWAISTELNSKIPRITDGLNVDRFKLTFSVPIVYVLVIDLFLFFPDAIKFPDATLYFVILIPIHLLRCMASTTDVGLQAGLLNQWN